RDGAPGVFDDAGGDAQAAGAARLGRAVAKVDAAIERALHQRVDAIAGADEDEIRSARKVLQPEAIARGVEQLLRLGDLGEIAAQVIEIAQRRLDGGDGRDVDAVDRNRLPDRVHRVGRADETADAQAGQAERFREGAADD